MHPNTVFSAPQKNDQQKSLHNVKHSATTAAKTTLSHLHANDWEGALVFRSPPSNRRVTNSNKEARISECRISILLGDEDASNWPNSHILTNCIIHGINLTI